MTSDRPSLPIRISMRLRRYFFSGLAALFPVVVTLYLLLVVFKFADGLLGRFINQYWLSTYGYEIPGLGLVMTVALILTAGAVSSHVVGHWMFRRMEEWFGRLPVVRRIYPSVKQFTQFLFPAMDGGRPEGLQRVVLAQYPRSGLYCIAFVTSETHTTANGAPQCLLTLLLPNPPSPFTGPLIFAPKEDVVPLTMSIEDAVKFIVSGGVVAPPIQAATTKHPRSEV